MAFLKKSKIKKDFKNIKSGNESIKVDKKVKLGLALGGGGARGFAHIGAIRAFEENNIKFDYVAGTSVGSLIGAFYCSGYTSQDMIKFSNEIKEKDIRTSKVVFVPSKTEGLEGVIKKGLGDVGFDNLKIPFSSVAVDIISGLELDITSGNLPKAVAGSCAVPGVFNPVEFDKYRLLDGGLQNNIPADVVRNHGCDYVITVDVNPSRTYGTSSVKLLELIKASLRIMMKSNATKGLMLSDIIIAPDTKRFKSTSFEGSEEMVNEGYEAAMDKMDEIKELVRKIAQQNKEYERIKLPFFKKLWQKIRGKNRGKATIDVNIIESDAVRVDDPKLNEMKSDDTGEQASGPKK